jgi:hypothetical protein
MTGLCFSKEHYMAAKKLPIPPHASPDVMPEIMDVTPALAKEWLATNKTNRGVSKAHQKKLEADMRAGRWVLNGEAIKFDANGDLLDGQHRLHAVINTGITIRTLVIIGVQTAAFATMDTGRSRSLADVLSISGQHAVAPTKLAAGVRMAMLLERGQIETSEVIPHPDALKWFELNPQITAFAYAPKITRALLPSPVYCGLQYHLWKSHPVKSAEFFDKFETGADLGTTHPIKVLRDRLTIQKGRLGSLRPLEVMALTIKAWNLFLTGKSITVLRWTKGDDFPVIK